MIRFWKSWFRPKKVAEERKDYSEWKRIDRLFKHKFATTFVEEADTFLYIVLIEVDKKHRRKRIGTKILKRIIWYAQRMKKDIVLEATDAVGTEVDVLIRYYEELGFQRGMLPRVGHRHNMFYMVNNW